MKQMEMELEWPIASTEIEGNVWLRVDICDMYGVINRCCDQVQLLGGRSQIVTELQSLSMSCRVARVEYWLIGVPLTGYLSGAGFLIFSVHLTAAPVIVGLSRGYLFF